MPNKITYYIKMKTLESVVENFINSIDSAKKTGIVGRYTLDEIKI